ncbi:MAG: DUF1667 domain-containing protein [Clostridia bacterium]|nr:DUF1667 domain-containing protein [Clostridia bacterium]
MSTIVCITCPRGCTMNIEKAGSDWTVTGNACRRGRDFAIAEMTDPRRTVCTTVRTTFKSAPALPCRVSADIPKDKMFDVMKEISKVTVSKQLNRGDVIIKDVLGLGVDVIATSDLLTQL